MLLKMCTLSTSKHVCFRLQNFVGCVPVLQSIVHWTVCVSVSMNSTLQ